MCELIERKRSEERARVCSHDCIVSVWPWRASDLWKSRERERERSEKHILYHRSLSKVSEFSCLCTHSEQQRRRRRRYSASTTLETLLFSMMNIVDEVSEWKGIDICVTEKRRRRMKRKVIRWQLPELLSSSFSSSSYYCHQQESYIFIFMVIAWDAEEREKKKECANKAEKQVRLHRTR